MKTLHITVADSDGVVIDSIKVLCPENVRNLAICGLITGALPSARNQLEMLCDDGEIEPAELYIPQ